MNAKNLLLSFWGMMFSISLSAQLYWQPVFHELGKEKLGVNGVANQTWDAQGRLWMICEEGLACFNGFSTEVWSHSDKDSNSLMSNVLQTFYLDREGVFWIAYLDTLGITRFDPKKNQFTHYLPDSTRENSFPPYLVVSFREDSKNRMWILTWDGGLVKFDRQKGTFRQFVRDLNAPEDEKHPLGNRIKGFCELKDGRFLLGYFGGGAPSDLPSYFDPETETFERFPVDEFLHYKDTMENKQIRNACIIINVIQEDEKGDIWFGSYSGLLHFDMKHKTAKRVTGIPFTSTTINLENVRGILDDGAGNYWIPTSNTGIMVVNKSTFTCRYIQNSPRVSTSLADNRIRSVRADKMGNIWVSTGAGGFSIFFPIVNQFAIHPWEGMGLEYSNRSAQIVPVNMMRVRNSRQVYISNENGISVYDPLAEEVVKKYPVKQMQGGSGLHANRVDHFTFQGTKIHFNSLYEVAYLDTVNMTVKNIPRFDPKRAMIKMFRHEKDLDTQFYYFSYGNGKTYFATLNEKQNKLDSFYLFKDSVRLVEQYQFVLNDGRWLLSCGPKGFMLFDPQSKDYEIFAAHPPATYFPDSLIRTAFEDREGMLWFTSENGLFSFDPKTKKHQCWNDSLGLKQQGTNAIVEDRNGVFWIALNDEILRWDRKSGKKMIFGKNLGLRVGVFLPSNPQLDEHGKIYMATLFGILTFDPALLKVPDINPVLRLASVIVKEDTLDVRDSAKVLADLHHLPWNKNYLEFSFFADQLTGPRPAVFYYRTTGLDTVWRENGNSNRIRYANLSHGTYTLEIKMVNAFGQESNTCRLTFVIARPFWLTWWFGLLVIAVLAFIVWRYIKYREQSHLKRQQELEQRVEERTAEVVEKAEEIKLQKDIIFEKNKELTDSIHYAQRIQQSILPDAKAMKKSMPDHFVLFKPKDIVSGDFYWYAHHGDSILWAVVDCTGHGVPGGFMSMLGAGLLGQIVNEEQILQPDLILNEMRERVILALRQTGEEGDSRDGMDISIARWKVSENILQIAAAHNSVYVIRENVMTELKADKQPIGIHGGEMKPFALQEYPLQNGDVIFMSSDGYYDQFGGEKGKKFKSSNFEKLITSISNESTDMQYQLLEETFVKWKGEFEQIDDVCVIGVRISRG